ncbi:beta-lactamase domain-containing protein [Rivularia sp. IAM M-261]|nr:beta-lactamase domain-containing protein [Rivularia sp. IAM M-261]
MLFRQLFDKETSTYTYLIADEVTKSGVLVDPVLEQVERDLQILQELGLTLRYSLETHIHADHITGANKLQEATGCLKILPEHANYNCADRKITDGEILQLGGVEIKAIATPGHTDSHVAYLINKVSVLTGDALLIRGCGRTDFQSGDAGTLYDSVTQRLFTLDDNTLVYPGHDYKGFTVSTIGEEKLFNARFKGHNRNSFIELMNNLNLPYPQKMTVAVPANEACGHIS